MNAEEVRDRLLRIRTWKSGDRVALHKPLLLLLALARIAQGNRKRLIPFREIQEPLAELLETYGYETAKPRPQYPFWRLQNDGIWEVANAEQIPGASPRRDVSARALVEHDVQAGLTPELYQALLADPQLLKDVIHDLLDAYFDECRHPDLLSELGIDLDSIGSSQQMSQQSFRAKILQLYNNSCAVCGYSAVFRRRVVGVEAAHIKPKTQDGPSNENNGIALCRIHHKLFDTGAFTLSNRYRVVLSPHLLCTPNAAPIGPIHDQPIRLPQDPASRPAQRYLSWHQKYVFSGDLPHGRSA